jgi:hypothetical protein
MTSTPGLVSLDGHSGFHRPHTQPFHLTRHTRHTHHSRRHSRHHSRRRHRS